MAKTDAGNIISSMLVIVIIGVIFIVFLGLVSFMIHYRTKKLERKVNSIDTGLIRFHETHLEEIRPIAESVWEERKNLVPIPDPHHVLKGWLELEDGTFINIRREISESFRSVEETANRNKMRYIRKPNQTFPQFLYGIVNQRGSKVNQRTVDQYLAYFLEARYGPDDVEYDDAQYGAFTATLNTLLSELEK